MNKCKYLVMAFLLTLFINISFVKADCTNEEIAKLKDEAGKIKVTYEHLGRVDLYDDILYNLFNVEITNVPNDFYIKVYDDIIYKPVNGKVEKKLSTGKWEIRIYSNKCEKQIDKINLKLPTFNMYSLDPLCEGIDGRDFPLCGKYYEPRVSYADFEKRVKSYIATHPKKNNNGSNDDKSRFEFILDYLVKYKYYFASGIILIIVLIILFFSWKKRRNRGVLK